MKARLKKKEGGKREERFTDRCEKGEGRKMRKSNRLKTNEGKIWVRGQE